jgi:hypothetical protein
MKTLLLTSVAALFLVTGAALAQTYRGPTTADDPIYKQGERPSALERYRPNYDPNADKWQAADPPEYQVPFFDESDAGEGKGPRKLRCVTTIDDGRNAKPLTPRQVRDYKALRSIGITKKDAARVVRDPGVKKGEWGWDRAGSASEGVICVKKNGSEWLMKYRNNVVVE